ncbi:hypothetical protein HMPREF0742_00726 [Rothia aeria F0184]|uniref:Uncharacterized protein n=1 Tax=Rothia aeria F0184 TaxID=888019 RepID=U7V5R1_9MICC|nr:hypothetical protein HMPREF0742_00726 [Rothia aeria F0184]
MLSLCVEGEVLPAVGCGRHFKNSPIVTLRYLVSKEYYILCWRNT